jgi:hypothetical protein
MILALIKSSFELSYIKRDIRKERGWVNRINYREFHIIIFGDARIFNQFQASEDVADIVALRTAIRCAYAKDGISSAY